MITAGLDRGAKTTKAVVLQVGPRWRPPRWPESSTQGRAGALVAGPAPERPMVSGSSRRQKAETEKAGDTGD